MTSAAPTWRDASAALAILSGLYLIIQAVVSFGVGGYIAGRTRTASVASHVSESSTVTVSTASQHGLWPSCLGRC